MKTRYFFLILLGVGIFTSTARSQVYELIDLGIIIPQSINDTGQVAGYYWGGGDSYTAYLWQNGASVDLGSITPFGKSVATAINSSGNIVGYSWPHDDYSQRHGFIWENGIMTDVGTFGGSGSIGLGLNDSNKVVGQAFFLGDTIGHAFLWQNGIMTDLGTIGGYFSAAYAINNSNQVVGYGTVFPYAVHAFMWEEGIMSDLGTLGGSTSYATAINNSSQVIGVTTINTNSQAAGFIWQKGVMTNLGAIGTPPGQPAGASTPYDINDSGVVVGQSSWNNPPGADPNHAFVWKNGTMTDLNSVTDTSGGWILTRAWGINNHGDIVGVANHYGYEQGFLLKKKGILLTSPKSGDFWIGGEEDTIRWKSGLSAGENIVLRYSLDDGATWKYLEVLHPADSEKYVWTVPDTFTTKARVHIFSASDFAKDDTSEAFKIKGYILTKLSAGIYTAYDPALDKWGFGNDSAAIWPSSWFNRFDYIRTDPFTGGSYLLGDNFSTEIFLNARPADHPDWPSFVNTFLRHRCYINAALSIYSPTALAKWASIKGSWNGSCFGFAVSNAIVFRNKTQLLSNYLNFPAYENDFPVAVTGDTNSIPVINEFFTHQFGNPHTTHIANSEAQKTPTQTLNELKTMLLSDSEPIRVLVLINNGPKGGGHGIVPYKLRHDPVQKNLYYLNVYDNAHPDVLEAQITIDTAQNSGKGSWDYPLWHGWGGAKGLFLMNPAIYYLTNPTLPKNDPMESISPFIVEDNTVEINTVRSASVLIRDAEGHETGYIDSVVHADIPGSHPKIIINGSETPPYGYSLPLNQYAVTLSDFKEQDSRTYFFVGNKTFSVERTESDSNQTDRFFFDGDLSVANPDTTAKTYRIVNIINESSQGREKVFSIDSLALSESDSVKILNINIDGLKLSSFATSPKTYKLTLELAAFAGIKQFNHHDISLSGNSSHIIQPDWPALGSDDLKILIDNGNDGSIDDSMFVSNQVTGIRQNGEKEIPTSFVLYQNYPNPFNPVTTINFDIPATGHVSLKIYDVLGREVATLVDEIKSPGVYTAVWEATAVPSGMYFYKLTAGSFINVKKMLLVK